MRGTADWDAPTPVAGWVARDVVGHLVEWFPAFLAGSGGPALPAGPPMGADPVTAWQERVDAVQRLLDDPAAAAVLLDNPHLGQTRLLGLVGRPAVAPVALRACGPARIRSLGTGA